MLTGFEPVDEPLGLLTISRHHEIEKADRTRRLRVVIDGKDVTTRCQAADDKQGWALIITEPKVRDFAKGCAARVLVVGDVRFGYLPAEAVTFQLTRNIT